MNGEWGPRRHVAIPCAGVTTWCDPAVSPLPLDKCGYTVNTSLTCFAIQWTHILVTAPVPAVAWVGGATLWRPFRPSVQPKDATIVGQDFPTGLLTVAPLVRGLWVSREGLARPPQVAQGLRAALLHPAMSRGYFVSLSQQMRSSLSSSSSLCSGCSQKPETPSLGRTQPAFPGGPCTCPPQTGSEPPFVCGDTQPSRNC